MWTRITHIVFRYRLLFIIAIAVITAFMGYKALKIEWSYNFAKAVPATDPEMQYFEEFKARFGEDGNILVIGVKDSSLYQYDNFRKFHDLNQELSGMTGVTNVLSMANLQKLVKDKKEKRFTLEPIYEDFPEDQESLDQFMKEARKLKFYSGQIINEENGASLLLVSIQPDILNSKKRDFLVEEIIRACDQFSQDTDIELHYSGLPFIRSILTRKVAQELQMLLLFSVAITGIIMFLFFRSGTAVLFPMIIIAVIVIWTLGTLALLDYKITLLTGLLPPLIVVIGIPNSVYLLNKYHQEYQKHGNKMMALTRVVQKIGLVTLITNVTTAIGFGVFAFLDILVLREFGIVAFINILATFLVSIILIPSVFSYLPPPNPRHLRHLKFKMIGSLLTGFDLIVHRHRFTIFAVTIGIIGVSIYGLTKMYAVSYIVDDIPEDSKIVQDLRFFEENFSGVMPLELVVDTGKKKGILRLKNLEHVNTLETFLADQKDLSQPISLVGFLKASRQAFYNDNPARYDLPTKMDKNFIFRYMSPQQDESELLKSFIDSTSQKMRISVKVADIGSVKMDSLITQIIKPKIASIFDKTDMKVQVTGTTLIFVKGNKFLVENLRNSFFLAIILISMIMAMLFGNPKMIILALIPNMIPLLLTAGMMGFIGMALKPSTALIFSVVFGISVDYSIHFLAKYRMELYSNNFFVPVAISKSIREMGSSMVYTSIILFFGFIIFSYSDFGGTVALGVLTSTTLLFAMFTNLTLLPALLLTFDSGKRKRDSHPLIEKWDDEFYHEDEDEEIDLEMIKIDENGIAVNEIIQKKN